MADVKHGLAFRVGLSVPEGVLAQAETGYVLCSGRYFGDEMLLSHGRHSNTCISVTFATVNVLPRRALYEALLSENFPLTWARLNASIVRRIFVRAVRLVVAGLLTRSGAR